jgi:metallo-beta-lactamase family protein
MTITSLGAAGGEVTGSSYLLEAGGTRVLVDCGMFQGEKSAEARNRALQVESPSRLDAVLLTHAHLDHCGRLPLLVKNGYHGPIFSTSATSDMAALILRDSAKIQAQDIERINRKRERAGMPPESALYTPQDVEATLGLFRTVPYTEPVAVAPGVNAAFMEAGHMLGSSCIRVTARNGAAGHSVVFSGDLGPLGTPILRDFENFARADTVVMESTYGDRNHRPFKETVDEFLRILRESVEAGGKVLIPTFAVGRAQLLTLLLAWAFRERLVKPFPVFLDSPMAIEASNIYLRHPELYDDEMKQFLREGSLKQDLATLQPSATAEDSKRINDVPGPCLVMAGAGMCTAGRILHHFKQNLWRPETHVVIVGYQARGSLGRMLIEGVERVRIFGEEIAVRARVHTLGGFSAHAGQKDLLAWYSALAKSRPKTILTHGENGPRRALASQIRKTFGITPLLPGLMETIEL